MTRIIKFRGKTEGGEWIKGNLVCYREDGTIDIKRRLGCMCCPMIYWKRRAVEFRQHPVMVRAYCRANGNRSAREIRQRMEADKPKLIEGLQRIQRAFEIARNRRRN